MHARQSPPPALERLIGAQSGAVSRQQCLGLGFGRHAVDRYLRSGAWQAVASGVFWAGPGGPDPAGLLWAAQLVGGDGARAWRRSAAYLHGLVDQPAMPVEMLVPVGRSATSSSWVRFTRERSGARGRSVGDPPRTRITDTVLDLCEIGRPDDVVTWVTKAVQSRLTTTEALTRAVERRSRLAHRALLAEVLGDVASGVHSHLERRFLHDVERRHRLPTPRRQFRVPGSRRLADAAFVEYGVLVELDGRIGHVAEGMWRDRSRDNAHALTGWVTLRFGWWEVVHDPCGVAAQIAAVLTTRGWGGEAACGSCVRDLPA